MIFHLLIILFYSWNTLIQKDMRTIMLNDHFEVAQQVFSNAGTPINKSLFSIESPEGYSLYDCVLDQEKVLCLLVKDETGIIEKMSICFIKKNRRSKAEKYFMTIDEISVNKKNVFSRSQEKQGIKFNNEV